MSGPSSNSLTPTYENIQALRGLAALLVLYAHIRLLVHLCNPSIPTAQGGGIGVDLFFVISGFVISLTASKRHHTAGDFLLARCARIVPLYLAANLVHLITHLTSPVLIQSHPSFDSVWNGLFFLPIFDMGAYTHPPIFVGWTLSFEMWFYLMFSFCLLFCTPARTAALFPLILAIGTLAGDGYTGEWYLPRFLTHPFAIEFALGCVVYQLRHRITGFLPWLLLVLAAGYFAFFSWGSAYLDYPPLELGEDNHYAWLRVVLWGVPVALIVAATVGLEAGKVFVLPQPIVWLGTISYSLYISHWPIVQVLSQIAARAHVTSPKIVFAVGMATCLTAGILCYYYVELPLTSRAQEWAKRIISERTRVRMATREANAD